MSSVEKILYEPTDNLVVNDPMDLGEENILQLDDGGIDKDLVLEYGIKYDSNWLENLNLKNTNSIDEKKKLLIKEKIFII